MAFHAFWCTEAVSVRTPSRSNSRAVTSSGSPSIARVYAPPGCASLPAGERTSTTKRPIGALGHSVVLGRASTEPEPHPHAALLTFTRPAHGFAPGSAPAGDRLERTVT